MEFIRIDISTVALQLNEDTKDMVYVTALPYKILITTLPICLYMFTAINNNK